MRSGGPRPAVGEDEDGAAPLGVMDGSGRIVVGPACRELRGRLRPIEWMVLEDVALDARRGGTEELVSATSARRVAENLGLTPGAVARALARLRSDGLVTHARQSGPAGRFGLSAYVLASVPGLEVVDPADAPGDPRLRRASPRMVPPRMDRPHAVDAYMVGGDGAGGPGGADAGPAYERVTVPAPVEGMTTEEGGGVPGVRSTPRRARRTVPKAAGDQLSILDANDDSQSDTNQEPRR